MTNISRRSQPVASARQVATLLPALLGLLMLLGGCDSVGPVVKVGLVAPFEGRGRDIGYDAIYSARLAVRELNRAGGINGTRVALVALDDGGRVDLATGAAAALGGDANVVAAVGHYLPETTAAAATIYARDGLPLLAAGQMPLGPSNAAALPAPFRAAYEAVTPFDETPGPYAGPTYDAFQLLWAALALAEQTGAITRESVQDALGGLEYVGLTGTVYQP